MAAGMYGAASGKVATSERPRRRAHNRRTYGPVQRSSMIPDGVRSAKSVFALVERRNHCGRERGLSAAGRGRFAAPGEEEKGCNLRVAPPGNTTGVYSVARPGGRSRGAGLARSRLLVLLLTAAEGRLTSGSRYSLPGTHPQQPVRTPAGHRAPRPR